MTRFRMLALDLDGTLLTEDKRISEETSKWVVRAADKGISVVLATGRGLQRVEMYREELGLDAPMVLLNGAEIWKAPGQVLKRHYLPGEAVGKVHRLAVESGARYWGYTAERLVGQKAWMNETEVMLQKEWLKFGITHHDEETMRQLWHTVKDFEQVEVTGKSHRSMEISAKGITKESGLREVCQYLGISMEEVVAVGDGPNDTHMLSSVGLGVAMGNAEEEIKQLASVITGTNEQDGVAQAIRQHIFGYSS